jgi:cytoskeleton protein RodZ
MNRTDITNGERLTAGAILASARKDQKLSVLEVARQLKIAPQQVEALEADAFDRLPGRVFARGFLRNYATLLGVDPKPLLRSIDGDIPSPDLIEMRTPSETVMPRGPRARWPLYGALATFVVVGALAVYEFGFNDAAEQSAPLPTVAPEPGEGAAPSSRNVDTVPGQHEKPGDPGAPSAPMASESVLARNASEGGGAGERQAAKVASATERQVHLRFDQDSWVEIRDGNNKVIFSKTSKAGRQEQVTGTPPFKVTVGNARGVRLQYEDKPIDLAPRTGVAVARVTLK